jgi:hypothetical protein
MSTVVICKSIIEISHWISDELTKSGAFRLIATSICDILQMNGTDRLASLTSDWGFYSMYWGVWSGPSWYSIHHPYFFRECEFGRISRVAVDGKWVSNLLDVFHDTNVKSMTSLKSLSSVIIYGSIGSMELWDWRPAYPQGCFDPCEDCSTSCKIGLVLVRLFDSLLAFGDRAINASEDLTDRCEMWTAHFRVTCSDSPLPLNCVFFAIQFGPSGCVTKGRSRGQPLSKTSIFVWQSGVRHFNDLDWCEIGFMGISQSKKRCPFLWYFRVLSPSWRSFAATEHFPLKRGPMDPYKMWKCQIIVSWKLRIPTID